MSRAETLALYALLSPTPLRWIDPTGEANRDASVRTLLGITSITADEQALIDDCRADAGAAELRANQTLGSGQLKLPLARRHPLSGQLIAPEVDVAEARKAWDDLIADLKVTLNTIPADKRTAHCWAKIVQSTIYRALPADATVVDVPAWSLSSLTAALVRARANGGDAAIVVTHIGPVGDFIRSARRTHDLWLGSYLLSFHAFVMAKYFAEQCGPYAIVAPHLADLPLAQALLFGGKPDRAALLKAAIPNKLTLIVSAEAADGLAEAACKEARRAWIAMSERVRGYVDRYKLGVAWDAGFDEQIERHFELDASVQPWPRDRARLLVHLDDTWHPSTDGHDDVDDRFPVRQGATIGDTYGVFYNRVHFALGAGRSQNMPPRARIDLGDGTEDIRPKCTQSGDLEQMGPVDHPLEVARFWKTLSTKVQGLNEIRNALNLKEGEGLSAVSLLKRFAAQWVIGGKRGQQKIETDPLGFDWDKEQDRRQLRFPSVASIASAAWRKALLDLPPAERDPALDALAKALNTLMARDALHFEPPGNLLALRGHPGFLQHDGEWSYSAAYETERTLRDFFDDDQVRDARREAVEKAMPDARRAYKQVRKLVGCEPSSYYAVLRFDGDGMGDWLTGKHPKTPKWKDVIADGAAIGAGLADQTRPLFPAVHGELSRRLTHLAVEVFPRIVEKHLGRLVYSGGDDALALLPVATVLPCLAELAAAFSSVDGLGDRATISAGIAIVHERMPLSRALTAARDAEKRAKAARRRIEALDSKVEELDESRRNGSATREDLESLKRLSDTAQAIAEARRPLLDRLLSRVDAARADLDEKAARRALTAAEQAQRSALEAQATTLTRRLVEIDFADQRPKARGFVSIERQPRSGEHVRFTWPIMTRDNPPADPGWAPKGDWSRADGLRTFASLIGACHADNDVISRGAAHAIASEGVVLRELGTAPFLSRFAALMERKSSADLGVLLDDLNVIGGLLEASGRGPKDVVDMLSKALRVARDLAADHPKMEVL